MSLFTVHSQVLGLGAVWCRGSKPDVMGAHAVKKEVNQSLVQRCHTHGM